MAREKQPDLILLDIMMPKKDSLEVCQCLKVDPFLPFMPIILIAAKVESEDIVAGLEAGSDEYLTNPVHHAELVARIKSMPRIKLLYPHFLNSRLSLNFSSSTKIQSLFWPDTPELEAGGHIWAVSVPATYVS